MIGIAQSCLFVTELAESFGKRVERIHVSPRLSPTVQHSVPSPPRPKNTCTDLLRLECFLASFRNAVRKPLRQRFYSRILTYVSGWCIVIAHRNTDCVVSIGKSGEFEFAISVRKSRVDGRAGRLLEIHADTFHRVLIVIITNCAGYAVRAPGWGGTHLSKGRQDYGNEYQGNA